MSTESKGPFHVGENVDLSAETSGPNVGVAFEIHAERADKSLALIDTRNAKSAADASNTTTGFSAIAPWPVHLTLPDGTPAPLQNDASTGLPGNAGTGGPLSTNLQVDAFTVGAGTKFNRILPVEGDGVLANAAWLQDPGDEPLSSNVVAPGTTLTLRVEVASRTGKPLLGDFTVRFEFLIVDGADKVLSTPKTLTQSITAPAAGNTEIVAKWTSETFNQPAPVRVRLRVGFARRPFETFDHADAAPVLSPILTLHDKLSVQLIDDTVNAPAREGLARQFSVKDEIQDGSDVLVNESPWGDATVELQFANGEKRTVDIFPDGKGGLTDARAATARALVITEGRHPQPVHWRTIGPNLLQVGDKPNDVRFSTRLRYSIWSSPVFVTKGNVEAAKGIVDDLTLLNTIVNTVPGTAGARPGIILDPVVLGPTVFPGKSPDEIREKHQKPFYNGMIKLCHDNGLQIMAGYGEALLDAQVKAFSAWIKAVSEDRTRRPELVAFVDELIQFLATHFPDPDDSETFSFDGISFDIEHVGADFSPGSFTDDQAKEMFTRGEILNEMYQLLAAKLRKKNKLVGVAGGGLVDDLSFGPSRAASSKNRALPSAIAHRYDVAVGAPNIVLRPMCYDSGFSDDGAKPGGPESPLFNWHEEVIAYALEDKKVHPSQFQIGIKNHKGSTGQGGEVTKRDRIELRCEKMLRPNRVGIIEFALFKAQDWGAIDKANKKLNEDPDKPGVAYGTNEEGQPLQAPLSSAQALKLQK